MALEIKFLIPESSSYIQLQQFKWDFHLVEENNRVVFGQIIADGVKNRLQSFIFLEGLAWFVPKNKVLPDETTAITDSIVIKPLPQVEGKIQELFSAARKLVPQFYIIENLKILDSPALTVWSDSGHQYGDNVERFFTKYYVDRKDDKAISFDEGFFIRNKIIVNTDVNSVFSTANDSALFNLKILASTKDYIDPNFFFKYLAKHRADMFATSLAWVNALPSTLNIQFFNEVGLPADHALDVHYATTGSESFMPSNLLIKNGNEHYTCTNMPVGRLKFFSADDINGDVFINFYPNSVPITTRDNFFFYYEMLDSFDQVCCQIVKISDWLAQQPSRSPLNYYTIGNKVTPLIDGSETYKEMLTAMNETRDSNDFVYVTGWSIDMNFKMVNSSNHPFFNKTLKEVFTEINSRGVKIRALFWDIDEMIGWLINTYNLYLAARSTLAIANSILLLFSAKKKISFVLRLLLSPRYHATRSAKNLDLLKQLNTLKNSVDNLVFPADDIRRVRPSCAWINDNLSNANAIADKKVRNLEDHGMIGSHHQKLMIIKARQKLYGFCGGIDIYADRVKPHSDESFPGQHDVHCKIEGSAVKDMLVTFKQRWEDQSASGTDRLPSVTDDQVIMGSCIVQIARTYGTQVGYSFTDGEQTISKTLIKAIGRAQRNIYIEDQYATNSSIANHLKEFVKRPAFEGLVILIPNWDIGNLYDERIRRFMDTLLPANDPLITSEIREKVFVFNVRNVHRDFTYIHSKTMIIDDFFTTIGSANMNFRSHTHDSEINAMIIDTEVVNGKRRFARDLRIRLWREHLDLMSESEAQLKLGEFKQGMAFLKSSPRIKEYKPLLFSADSLISDELYNNFVDPNISMP